MDQTLHYLGEEHILVFLVQLLLLLGLARGLGNPEMRRRLLAAPDETAAQEVLREALGKNDIVQAKA